MPRLFNRFPSIDKRKFWRANPRVFVKCRKADERIAACWAVFVERACVVRSRSGTKIEVPAGSYVLLRGDGFGFDYWQGKTFLRDWTEVK